MIHKGENYSVKLQNFFCNGTRKWNNTDWNDKKNGKKLPPSRPTTGISPDFLTLAEIIWSRGDGIIASSYLVATQNELPVESKERVTNPNDATIEKRMEYIWTNATTFSAPKNILF